MATTPLGAPYNVLFKNATDGTVGDDNLKYMYDASQPFLEIGGAASADKGMIQLGGATGSGEIKSNQVQITSAGNLTFQFPTVAVDIDPQGNIRTPANVIAFEGTLTGPTNVAVQSSVQLFTGAGTNQPTIAWVDKSRPANDRVAFTQFSAGKLSFAFGNDAFTGSTTWMQVAGGTSGVTAITSTAANWTHNGFMVVNGVGGTTPSFSITSTSPSMEINKTTNGTNMKRWVQWVDGSGNYFLGSVLDNGTYSQHATQTTRTAGVVTSHRMFVNGTIIASIDGANNNFTGNLLASATVLGKGLSAGNNAASVASPTNSGATMQSASNYGGMSLYDATQPANARGFNLINFQGKTQFRIHNDTGANVIVPLSINGGYANYTGLTMSGNLVHNNATTTDYANPLATLQSNGANTNQPILMFHANNGPDANRKKWFINGNNGNFFSYGISDDAGTNNFIAYQAYRGNGTVGGHQWFLGNAGITTGTATPSMFLSNNVFSLMPGIQMVMGDTIPVTSTILALRSTTQGFLPPQMTTAQMHAIPSPANGLMVINTTTNQLCIRFGGSWYPWTAGAPVPEEPIEP